MRYALYYTTASCSGFVLLADLTFEEAGVIKVLVDQYNLHDRWKERNQDGHAIFKTYPEMNKMFISDDKYDRRSYYDPVAFERDVASHLMDDEGDGEVYRATFRAMVYTLVNHNIDEPFSAIPGLDLYQED